MGNAMPKVRAYPLCSACAAPYVLRLVFIVLPKAGQDWLWQRDCKHKKAPPVSSSDKHHAARAEASNG